MFLRSRTKVDQTDEELVQLLREGHRSALSTLWDRYADLLYGVGMKYLSDCNHSKDEVVELFASLKDLLTRHEVARFRPWVHTVMRNRCLQALRRSGTMHVQVLNSFAEDSDGDEAILREANLLQLERALAGLNVEQQRCITLFYLEDMSYAQVAGITGLPMEKVRSHLQNGRRNLRIAIERQKNHEDHEA